MRPVVDQLGYDFCVDVGIKSLVFLNGSECIHLIVIVSVLNNQWQYMVPTPSGLKSRREPNVISTTIWGSSQIHSRVRGTYLLLTITVNVVYLRVVFCHFLSFSDTSTAAPLRGAVVLTN